MGKQRKKAHCICKGRPDREHRGSDRQKHIEKCPLVVVTKK